MSVKAAPRLQWILAGILCLCTLVALWATAMRVREQKLAARRGDRGERVPQEAPPRTEVDTVRSRKIPLPPGRKVAVEHFSLVYRDDAITVAGSDGRSFVDFLHLKKGEQRGWQELRLTILELDPSGPVVEAEFRPGAPCTGDGRYTAIRAGLQIEFDGRRLVTITAWDPAKPELKLRVQRGDHVEEQTLGENARTQSFGLGLELRKRAPADWDLVLESK
jgi:hypothetical protein